MGFDKQTKKTLETLYGEVDNINKEIVRIELPVKALERRKLELYERIVGILETKVKDSNKFKEVEEL